MSPQAESQNGLQQPGVPIPALAITGSSIFLPGGIHTREQLYDHCRQKCQTVVDTVQAKRFHWTDIDEEPDPPHPWKIKSRYSVAFTQEEATAYDAHLLNISGKLAKNMYFHQFAALTMAFEVLEDAGIPLHKIYKTRTGVFCAAYAPFLPANEAPDETFLRGSAMSSISDQVHYFLGTHGPSATLETACSSSLVALSMAASALVLGDCDTAIIFGLNFLSGKDFQLSLQACGVLVQGPTCHPFDEDGNKGFMRAEGMGAVVLRRLSDAERVGDRILCKVLRGLAAHGGASDGALEGAGRVYEQPCKFGMRQMYHRAFSSANVPLKRLNYMECHATGTTVGDIIEIEAIGDVFGDSHDLESNPLRMASVKANIGHAEIAAGMFSLIKILAMFKERQYLPTAGVTTPLKSFDWEGHNIKVQLELEPFPGNENVIVGIDSFGIGGAYGFCLLEEYRQPSIHHSPQPCLGDGEVREKNEGHFLPLSAVGLEHLKLFAERLGTYLKDKPATKLQDICATMWIHRSRFKFRKSFIANTSHEMAEQLAGFAKTANVQPAGEGRKMQCAYVFTGQGSQYPGVGKSLMQFPVYRQAVTTVDRIFRGLSGWSILEKLEALTPEQMRDTMFAQPITFLVQIGLFELLKSFKVFPDIVAGHSAGEVTAAYAAGLLTLEESVHVVYHRSHEQQRMAGSGRLLVVGLNHEEVKRLVEPFSDVEIACYNSPESTVLASSEERLQGLLEVKVFPENVPTVFVPGNIAFHSSRITPILEDMRTRLSFLNKRGNKGWTLPFISTVSGKIETRTDADYWVHNVRRPVMFQQAIETMFVGDTIPDVVLEIGPHQTLVSPIRQILGATGKQAAVMPTLKKGAPCAQRFMEALGALFERGIEMDLEPYLQSYGYTFQEDMPKHPMIKKPVTEVFSIMKHDLRNGVYIHGPVAGYKKLFEGSWVVEVSDRTFREMTDHVMGGNTILPGMFFVEMALEATRQLPCTLTNIEFKSMCRIPTASKGDPSTYIYLTMKEEQDDVRSFTVQSCPSKDKMDEEPLSVTHCLGKVMTKHELLTSEDEVFPGFKPEAFGLLQGLALKDVGEEGLKQLIEGHSEQRFPSKAHFYDTWNVEGTMEYREHFQQIQWSYHDPLHKTYLAKYTYDLTSWHAKGGVFPPELLDGLLHMGMNLCEDAGIYYNGGFDAAHFFRKPSTPDLYCHFKPDPQRLQIGRRGKVGDFALYDGTGKMVLYIQGFFCILGGFIDNYKAMDLQWQPYNALAGPATELQVKTALNSSMPVQGEADWKWSAEENEQVTSYLAQKLRNEGCVEEGEGQPQGEAVPVPAGDRKKGEKAPSVPLSKKVSQTISQLKPKLVEPASDPTLPSIHGLDEVCLKTLAGALVDKVKNNTRPAQRGEGEGEARPQGDLTAEQLRDILALGTFQDLEARRIAHSLHTLAQSNHAAVGHNYVIRILELAEDNIPTVYEALSHLPLPSSIIVEYFLGSFNTSILSSLANKVNRRPANLRLRRVLFSPNVARELKDMSFEAVVLGDWIRSGQMVWQEGKEGKKAPGNVMDTLANFMAPNAQLYIRGLNDIPLWVRLLSQLSPSPLSLAPESNEVPPSKARDEWLTVLHAYGDVHSTSLTPTSTLLSCSFTGQTPEASQASGQVIVFAETAEDGQQAAKAINAKNRNIRTHVYAIGSQTSPLTDASEVSDYEDVLRARLSAFVNHKAEEDSGKEDDTESLSSITTPFELQGNGGDNLPLAGMLFLAGCRDQDSIGEKGFGRLMKLVQAIAKVRELIQIASNDVTQSLWVVTRGVYVGDIVPAQGVLQGFSYCLNGEVSEVTVKFVDLNAHLVDSESNSQALASLLVNDSREKSYTIDDGHVSVPRTNARHMGQSRSTAISAEDPQLSYFADSEKFVTPGKIGVRFRLRDLGPPRAGEVQVDVYAAALNFRDVMIGLSMLPEKSYEASYYGKAFGMEAAGVVRALGEGVDTQRLQVGDKVIISAASCFSNRLNLPADKAVRLSNSDMTFEDAASIQSVYNTSHHALVNLARLRKGEKILIHSAAGGIGHAAISIAKYLGAEIYATAGSEEKRQIVRDLGVTHIYNSRSTQWFHDLMRDTDGRGVDVVLNSLAGRHQRLGIQALRSSGRFCEIGKVDIFDDNKLGLLAFRKNISFFAIDMDRLLLDDPQLSTEVATEVGHRFEAGDYARLPIKTFPMGQIKEALEFMKSGKHTGKVVLMNYEKEADGSFQPLPVTVERPQRTFHANATYLITGGGGGFGSRLVKYAWAQGARHFIVTTRSSNHDKIAQQFKVILEDATSTLQIVTCDTGKETDMQDLCNLLHNVSPPTRAIFHCAGLSNDVIVPDLTLEKYHEVADCKAKAAWLLHEGTLDLPLETFVTISSIAAHVGGKGTASYSAANAYLDALVRYRRSQGLPALTYNMAAIFDVGILANNLQARKFQQKVGMEFVSCKEALGLLEDALTIGMQEVIAMFFTERTRGLFPMISPWSYQLDDAITLGAIVSSKAFMNPKEIAAFLADEIRSITGVTEVLTTSQLTALGLDSLGFVELGGRMKKAFGIEADSVKMSAEMTLDDVSKMVYKLQQRGQTAGSKSSTGAEAAAQASESADTMVLHTKQEMNSMITSAFDSPTMGSAFSSSLSDTPRRRPLSLRLSKRLVLNSTSSELSGSSQSPRASKFVLNRLGNVLIFGADDFRGAHMLRYLIKGGAKTVYCIGKWSTAEGGMARLTRCMQQLNCWKEQFAKHIVPISGDVAKANFALPVLEYQKLVRDVNTVVHASGSLKWYMDPELIAANVSGLMNIVAFCRKNKASIHYLSTAWVSGWEAATEEERKVIEALPYVNIKRRSEDVLHYAVRHYGLRAAIYRLPALATSRRGGNWTAYGADNMLFQAVQKVYASRMVDAQHCDDVITMATVDDACKSVVATMKSRQGTTPATKGMAAIHLDMAIMDRMTTRHLADWVEELTGRQINRESSSEDLIQWAGKYMHMEGPFLETWRKLQVEAMPALHGVVKQLIQQMERRASSLQNFRHQHRFDRLKGGSPSQVFKSFLTQNISLLTKGMGVEEELEDVKTLDTELASHSDDTAALSSPVPGGDTYMPVVAEGIAAQ